MQYLVAFAVGVAGLIIATSAIGYLFGILISLPMLVKGAPRTVLAIAISLVAVFLVMIGQTQIGFAILAAEVLVIWLAWITRP